jgi:hypothetical protein
VKGCETLRLSDTVRAQQLKDSCNRLEQLFNRTGNVAALEVAAFTGRFGSAFFDSINVSVLILKGIICIL